MINDNDTEKAYAILRVKAGIQVNADLLEQQGDIRRSDGLMISERLRDLQAELADLEGNDEARQEAEDYNDGDPYDTGGWSLRDDGRNDDGSGESYAERNA